MSFQEVVQTLAKDEIVAVVTTKADGQQTATPIWALVVDGVPYVRSAYGEKAWWYRHILAGRPVSFVVANGAVAEQDRAAALALPRVAVGTTYVPLDDDAQAKIDAEVTRKYDGQLPIAIEMMLDDKARSCTLRIHEVG